MKRSRQKEEYVVVRGQRGFCVALGNLCQTTNDQLTTILISLEAFFKSSDEGILNSDDVLPLIVEIFLLPISSVRNLLTVKPKRLVCPLDAS